MRFGIILLAASTLTSPADAGQLDVRLYPPAPLIEVTRFGQALNFDVELTNRGAVDLELTAIRAHVRDERGVVAARLEINNNGIAPGLETVPTRSWKAGESRTVPFHTLASDLSVDRIDYEFVFSTPDKQNVIETVTVKPQPYRQKTGLIMPLPGRVLVWDGHDHASHHRRWNFSHPISKRLGLTTNSSRYSFDFVIVDEEARFVAGEGKQREDYPSYGHPVVAPAEGSVVAVNGTAPNEPTPASVAAYKEDALKAIFGNYVVIDHGNGEFSQLGHLKQGSLAVKAGDKVNQGQVIARAGASGTSLFPHLHYQLVDRADNDGEGLPARFDQASRVIGSRTLPAAPVVIDTGDIVISPLPGMK